MARAFKSDGCSIEQFRDHRRHESGFADYCGRRRRQWFSFQPDNLPPWACCYAFYIDGELVYIGQTENLAMRFRAHAAKSRWMRGKSVTIKAKLSRRFGDWAMTEIRLIKRLQPIFNRRGIASRSEVM